MENLAAIKAFIKDMHKEVINQKKFIDCAIEGNIEQKAKVKSLEEAYNKGWDIIIREIEENRKEQQLQWEGIAAVLQQHKERLAELEKPKPEMYYPATRPN